MSRIKLLLENEVSIAKEYRCDWNFLKEGVEVLKLLRQDFLLDDAGLLNFNYFGKTRNQIEVNWQSIAYYKTYELVNPLEYVDANKAIEEGWDYGVKGDGTTELTGKPWEIPDSYFIFASKTVGDTSISSTSVAVIVRRKKFVTPKGNEITTLDWETHERNILYQIKGRVNPNTDPVSEDSCPSHHPGHGYNYFNAHRKMAYNDFGRVGSAILEQMFEEAKSLIPPNLKIVDAPYADEYVATSDDFGRVTVNVNGYVTLLAVKLREDKWYDLCLSVFTNFRDTDRPDIS